MRLKDKICIITGAGSGFGRAIAETFAREGACCVVNDIDDASGENVAGELNARHNGQALFVHADVSDDSDVKALMEATTEHFGGLDIIVNNAGYTHRNKPLLEVTEDEFDRIYAVNVKAIFLSTRYVVPLFEARGGGIIINTASTAGIRPRPGLTWYNSSKGAVITATKSLAVELAPRNIRVNALCPVIGETSLLELFMGEDTPENRAKFISTIPLGRMSTPRDIANAALFLASDEAEFITGTALEVDGGRCV
jgi:3-oxoacyl-[acyl-carrier protein] reductase